MLSISMVLCSMRSRKTDFELRIFGIVLIAIVLSAVLGVSADASDVGAKAVDRTEEKTAEKTVEKSSQKHVGKAAYKDVPNTADSKQKHLDLVRSAIFCSSRYKQYSDADKNNVRILLAGLEPMAVKFCKPAEVENRILDAYENYSCAVGAVLILREDIESSKNRKAKPSYVSWGSADEDSHSKDKPAKETVAAEFARLHALQFSEKRLSFRSLFPGDLYFELKCSKDELMHFCDAITVDRLSRILSFDSIPDGTVEDAFQTLQRLEKYLKERYGGPVIDDRWIK